MEIKWHDKSCGIVKNERWVKIPEGKAHAMLRRRFPKAIDDILRELRNGREVRCPDYSMRDEDAKKPSYVQDSDVDDFDTLTFFPPGVSPVAQFVMDIGGISEAVVYVLEPTTSQLRSVVFDPTAPRPEHITSAEVRHRCNEFWAKFSRCLTVKN